MHELITQTLGDTTIEQFRDTYLREHAITRKVLHAFPPDQADLKPHERSSAARALVWTFVLEEMIMLKVLSNEPIGGGSPKAPESWQAILDAFDEQHEKMKAKLDSVDDASLNPVKFFVAPKEMADFAPLAFLFRFLFDQIHHRGQLSVYLRIAGGKVPSIYGPSGDEPWF
jgi:uncharacterized damage-inducible protein DinB